MNEIDRAIDRLIDFKTGTQNNINALQKYMKYEMTSEGCIGLEEQIKIYKWTLTNIEKVLYEFHDYMSN